MPEFKTVFASFLRTRHCLSHSGACEWRTAS